MPHVQIRNMPDDMHRKLKVKAAEAGMSLSEYLLKELRPVAELPSLEEWVRRVRSRKLYTFDTSAADLIRADREERERQLSDRH
jgi:antitoxin FitA